jgi:hypothetical protein
MVAPRDRFYINERTQEDLVALRVLLSRNPCAARFGAEILSELLYAERYLLHRMDVCEVECLLEALRVEGEVLA